MHPPELPADVARGQLIRNDSGEMRDDKVTTERADFTAKAGDRGTLIFLRGGPTGGFWQFRKF